VLWRFFRPPLALPRSSATHPHERERQQPHNIKRAVAVTHRDCSATRLAVGEAAMATRQAETAVHAEALRAFPAEVARRKPTRSAVACIMDLNGSGEAVS